MIRIQNKFTSRSGEQATLAACTPARKKGQFTRNSLHPWEKRAPSYPSLITLLEEKKRKPSYPLTATSLEEKGTKPPLAAYTPVREGKGDQGTPCTLYTPARKGHPKKHLLRTPSEREEHQTTP
jgi:hypothetical protein